MATIFWENYEHLCMEKGVTPSYAATQIGLSPTVPSTWKGRGSIPNPLTLSKIADYFGVSVRDLISEHDGDEFAAAVLPKMPNESLSLSEEETLLLDTFRSLPVSSRVRFLNQLLEAADREKNAM